MPGLTRETYGGWCTLDPMQPQEQMLDYAGLVQDSEPVLLLLQDLSSCLVAWKRKLIHHDRKSQHPALPMHCLQWWCLTCLPQL